MKIDQFRPPNEIGLIIDFGYETYRTALEFKSDKSNFRYSVDQAVEYVIYNYDDLREKRIKISKSNSRWKIILSEVLSWCGKYQGINYIELSDRIQGLQTIKKSTDDPVKIKEGLYKKNNVSYWLYNWSIYTVNNQFSDEECRLLILDEFDKERRQFEKLRLKFNPDTTSTTSAISRPRISENVRVEVWRRDGGKCARCGSREKLEYDHIVPISRGGSNTTRNIELLCEKCNRSKSDNIV